MDNNYSDEAGSDDEQPQQISIRAVRKKQVKAPAKRKTVKKAKPTIINNVVRVSQKLKDAINERLQEGTLKPSSISLLTLQPQQSKRQFVQHQTISRNIKNIQVVLPAKTYQNTRQPTLTEIARRGCDSIRSKNSLIRRLKRK